MARKKYKEETRPWDWQPPVEEVQDPDPDRPLRIEDVDGRPIEIRKRPGFGEVARPPSLTWVGPNGESHTERLVAAAWYVSHYQPWRRRRRGEQPSALPALRHLDGLLSDNEEDHERIDSTE